jgi:2-keto-3-deoxy-L-rhamnonate aldolase RhmA
MKTTAIQALRKKLAADETAFGLWVTLEAPSITEMAVALGLDWVVIDAEHGHLDWKEIVEHVRAAVRSETVVLVRIAELNGALIKRALDIGADGIVIPWIETAEQLKQAVAWARYPTEGLRGIGAERATAWGQSVAEHAAEANDHVLVVPIIETVNAFRQVPQMCQVDGVELLWFGPADYSSTAGFRGQWEGPGVAEQILQMKDQIRAAGRHCGLIATSVDNMLERQVAGLPCDRCRHGYKSSAAIAEGRARSRGARSIAASIPDSRLGDHFFKACSSIATTGIDASGSCRSDECFGRRSKERNRAGSAV